MVSLEDWASIVWKEGVCRNVESQQVTWFLGQQPGRDRARLWRDPRVDDRIRIGGRAAGGCPVAWETLRWHVMPLGPLTWEQGLLPGLLD